MGQTVVTIMHKTMKDVNHIIQINPNAVPNIGHSVNMGFTPASKVIEVLWDYLPNQTNVFVVVD
jgi:hypothetical protein